MRLFIILGDKLHGDCLADARQLARLQDPQQLDLNSGIELADLVVSHAGRYIR